MILKQHLKMFTIAIILSISYCNGKVNEVYANDNENLIISELYRNQERDLRKEKREKYEKINHAYAFEYIKKTLVNKKRKDIQLQHLLRMHYFILRRIDSRAGKLRVTNVKLVAQPHVRFPDYQDVPRIMDNFIQWLNTVEGDPVKIAIRAFCTLVLQIHPFPDGNGRTSRLFLNLLLMQEGYKPLHFHKKLYQNEYYQEYIPALNKVLFFNDYSDFDALISSRLVKRSANKPEVQKMEEVVEIAY